jgi:hypothetical protein
MSIGRDDLHVHGVRYTRGEFQCGKILEGQRCRRVGAKRPLDDCLLGKFYMQCPRGEMPVD